MIGPTITAPRDALTFYCSRKMPAICGGPKVVSKLFPIVAKVFARAKMTKNRIVRADKLENTQKQSTSGKQCGSNAYKEEIRMGIRRRKLSYKGLANYWNDSRVNYKID